MAYAHIAHDCVIGDGVVLVNATSLSGHIIVEDRAFISGVIGAHQFVRFGKLSMTGGMSRIVKDVLPFSTVEGNPARLIGANAIGLKRVGMAPAVRSGLKKAISFIMHDKLNTTQAIKKIEGEIEISDEIRHLINFVNQSERGVIR
jgi:UDP-N-acetylglucosamine acyltransferase